MKVLIVEDQPAVAKALRVLFDLNDIETESTSSPDVALRAMAQGDVDLVLQDMNFSPGATSGDEGIALFRRLRQSDPDLPVLLLTAWTSLETAVQLVKEGASTISPSRGRRQLVHHRAHLLNPHAESGERTRCAMNGCARARRWRATTICAALSTKRGYASRRFPGVCRSPLGLAP